MRRSIIAIVVAGTCSSFGCDSAGSSEGLNPAGPPEVLQVFVRERDGADLAAHLAFGDHPDIPADADDRDVTDAVAATASASGSSSTS